MRTIALTIFFLLANTLAFASPKVFDIERATWEETLSTLQMPIEEDFLDKIAEGGKELRQMRDTEHFQKLNSSPKRDLKDNPLWQKRKKYRYMTSLNLTKTDFARTIEIIRFMQEEGLENEQIVAYVPYVVLGLCERMPASDIRFYIRRDTRLGTPITIATDRLYRAIKFAVGEL